jgi:amino acid adenylation domain-containing protein/non-ribosomal peptide synthase protein (TIGR01720 family)
METQEQSRQLSFAASQYTKEKEFWLNYLAGEPEKTCVHYDVMDAGPEGGELLTERFELDCAGPLVKLSKGNDHRLHMILLAVVTVLLDKYLASGDLIVASPIYKQETQGDFLNTMLMFRFRPQGGVSFRDYLLKEVRRSVVKATEHQNYPLELLMKQLEIPGGVAGCPFFEIVVMLENVHDISYLGQAKPRLIFSFSREGERLNLTLHYNRALYRRERMAQIFRHLTNVASAVAADIAIPINDIDPLDHDEKEYLTRTLNDTTVPYPDDRTIDSLLRETAAACEHRVAVTFADTSLSYGELWRRGLGLAGYLAGLGVRRGEPVAFVARHSLEAIVGVVGIVAAGGAYMPVNPDYPTQRKTFLLKDSAARILLTPIELEEKFDCRVVDLRDQTIYRTPLDNDSGHDSRSPAYCLYTSGSTGNPKGVVVEHRSVVRLVKNIRYISFQPEDRLLQTAPIEFDPSTFEIWGMLLNGLGLFVVKKETILDVRSLGEAIVRFRASMLWMTTPLFNNMVQTAAEIFKPLRLVMVGGDTLSPYHINLLHQRFPKLDIMNMYGPTENTTYSTTHLVDRRYEGSVPIGTPVDNSTVFVLNTNRQLVPEGVIGELWVGGDGVARGYLNNPHLTAGRFKTLPHLDRQQMYWTGDWARWKPDRTLEFFGRKDGQVKIRGNRIEPMEIANRLLDLEAVEEAVVVDRVDDSGEKYLAAYVVAREVLDVDAMKGQLSRQLPAHMMPSYFVTLDRIPLKFSGKVDKAQLPDPQKIEVALIPPRTAMETAMRDLWAGVLGIDAECIGIDADFFDIGGHSLKATILSVNIQKQLGLDMTLEHIFEYPTIREMAQLLDGGAGAGWGELRVEEERDTYPATPAQARLMILERLEGAGAYNVPMVLKLEGNIDPKLFKETLGKLTERHQLLRASFHTGDAAGEAPIMKIQRKMDLPFRFRTCSEADVERRIKEFVRPFDIGRAPLFRVELLRTGDTSFVLAADFHHLIMDGASQALFVNEFLQLYNGEELPPLEFQYRDYALFQQRAAQEGVLEEQLSFWRRQLSPPPAAAHLPCDFSRPPVQRYEGARYSFTLQRHIFEGFKRLAADENSTLFMTLLALFNLFLAKVTGQEDLVVGTPVAGRRVAGLDRVLGMFVNTLAMRNELQERQSFRESLRRVRANALQAFDHQDVPFEEVVEALRLPRDTSRNPLFDVMFSFHNPWDSPGDGDLEQRPFIVQPYPFDYNISKFDLTLVVEEGAGDLRCSFEYSTHLFQQETIRRLAGYFDTLSQSVLADVDAPVYQLRYLTTSQEEEILHSFNQTTVEPPAEDAIQRLLETQAAALPDAVAVVGAENNSCLTYRRLARDARRVAAALHSKGIGTGTIVAVSLDRSLDLMKGIFGILTAGAAYLPLEPSLPSRRRQTILARSGAVDPAVLDACLEGTHQPHDEDEPIIGDGDNLADAPAYVLYTSGSTGEPKGVLVRHHAVLNLLAAMGRRFPCEAGDAYLLKTSCMFDVSVTELFGWMSGGRVILAAPSSQRDPRLILRQCLRHRVTHINFVPSMFGPWLDALAGEHGNVSLPVKYAMLAGEAMPPALVQRYRRLGLNGRLENLYGPTEATVYAAGYSLSDWTPGHPVPIGKPLDNVRLYVLDRYLQPVGIGVKGHLYIGGDGLAAGYADDPQLTAEAFVTAPFAPFEQLYASGDLARWNNRGELEFFGRSDHQVKVRGNRVELGEVEYHLALHPAVAEAVAIVAEEGDGGLCLCGYVIQKDDTVVEPDQVMDFLRARLPSYMVPDYLVKVDLFPRTPSGKIDRSGLPAPLVTAGQTSDGPRDQLETRLAGLWAEALALPEGAVDIHRSFFDSGGHSLKANLLVHLIHREFALRLPLIQIFKTPTVAALANVIASSSATGFTAVAPSDKMEYYPLSPAQHRLFALQQLEPHSVAYNMPYSVAIEGDVEVERLAMSFRRLIRRHEILRTSFTLADHQPVQRVHDTVPFNIEIPQHRFHDFIRPFDLSAAPLFRVELYRETEDRHILTVDIHHIVADGISLSILLTEFTQSFNRRPLSPLNLQYRDYCMWLTQPAQTEALQRQQAYWLDRFSEEPPALELPLDFPRPPRQSQEGGMVSFSLGAEQARALKQLAAREGMTLFMISLTLFFLLLRRLSGQEDLVVGTTAAGRNHGDFSQVIGMFVNTLPIRVDVPLDMTLLQLAGVVRDRVLESADHQDYPFEELVEQVVTRRDLSRNPLFDVMFDLREEPLGLPPSAVEEGDRNTRFIPLEAGVPAAKFDMEWVGVLAEEEIVFSISYAAALFKKETVERFARYYETVCRAFLLDPSQPASAVELCSPEERERILRQFSGPVTPLDIQRTVLGRFQHQAASRPHAVAVVHRDRALTYEELLQASASIAGSLVKNGMRRGGMVSLLMERGPDMLAAILGTWFAGGVYIPIETQQPPDRIRRIAAGGKSEVIITDSDNQEISREIAEGLDSTIVLDGEHRRFPGRSCPQDCLDPEGVAYVIYTSGTTGEPKGAMVHHPGMLNHLEAKISSLGMTTADITGQTASAGFDISVWQFLAPVLSGGICFVVDRLDTLDPSRLLTLLKRERVTVWEPVPSLIRAFLDVATERADSLLPHLRWMISTGEALDAGLLKRWLDNYPAVPVVNAYGPTECSDDVTHYVAESREVEVHEIVPVGQPLQNLHVYIMDQDLRLCPVGVKGEICVAGVGVGPGYWDDSQKTAEVFAPNPLLAYIPQPGYQRLYRTGDSGYYLEDGNIVCLGRLDFQVKIKGNRVELGEIEAHLASHPHISEAVVTAPKDEAGEAVLCAYAVCADGVGKERVLDSWRDYLSERVPAYMVPAHLTIVETMPLTANGKIDRRALPAPDMTPATPVPRHMAPDELERSLLDVWRQVLGHEQLGIHDNYFMSGGDSIKTIQIASRMGQLGYRVQMADIFRFPTVAQLAATLKSAVHAVDQSPVTGEVPLTPIQRRFFQNHTQAPHHYNQSVMFHVKEALSPALAQAVLEKIALHHDALRLTFAKDQNGVRQYNLGPEDVEFAVAYFDLRTESEPSPRITRLAAELQGQIDLAAGPLFKVALFHCADGDRFLLIFHHLVIDGVSWRILFEDIGTLLEAAANGEPLRLPLKTNSYKDWAERLADYASSGAFAAQMEYWRQLDGLNLPPLPRDMDGPDNKTADADVVSIQLEGELTGHLLTAVNEPFGTEINDILLTGLGLALLDTFGLRQVLVALEGHGREPLFDDLDITRTVGWFSCIYPVPLDMAHGGELGRQIKEVKEGLRRISHHGIGYGIWKYLAPPETAAGMRGGSQPSVIFNYLGQFDRDADNLPGFSMARESSGDTDSPLEEREFDLDISCMVAGGRMSVSLRYNRNHFKRTTVEALLRNYSHRLDSIAAFCLELNDKELTPSDLTYKDLSLEALDEIGAMFEQ